MKMFATLRYKSSSFITWLAIFILAANFYLNHSWKRDNIIASDTFCYYAFLPSYFIKHDVSLKFMDVDQETPFKDLWYSFSPIGIRTAKVTMGWAMMNAPFFLLAHFIAPVLNYPADGFSLPYRFAICFATLFYACAALLLLREILSNYFSDRVASIVIAVTMFGTNLYYYTLFSPGMTHALSFFLFSCFFRKINSCCN